MSEINTTVVVGVKPTTTEIIAQVRKQGAFKPAAGSGKAGQGSDGSIGRSLGAQASEANKRALVLKTRMEGVVPSEFSYAAAIKRFSDLQQTTGVVNLALAGLDLSFISANPFNSINKGSHEHSICIELAEGIKSNLHNPDTQDQDSLARLKTSLVEVGNKIPNEAVSQEISSIVEGIDQIRADIFSKGNIDRNVVWNVTQSNPTSNDSSYFQNIQRNTDHNYHRNTMKLSANAYACADLDPEAAAYLKSSVQGSLQKSWVLAHKLEVLAKTQSNMQGATAAIKDLKTTVRSILISSDNLLRREHEALKLAEKN